MTNQASEDDDFRCWDCKSENLPYCVECSPYLQGGEKGTDTNQASEETIDEIFEGLARYNCNAFTQDTLPNEIPPYAAKERVIALIRTEKLKLLAEVRERVVGEDKPLQGKYRASGLMSYDMTNHYENSLRAEQRAVLTKLEAEL